jgi:hypothetical protein
MPRSRGSLGAVFCCVVAAALVTGLGAGSAQPAPTAQTAAAPAPKESAATTAAAAQLGQRAHTGERCAESPSCSKGNCSNTPFKPTNCWTTQYGPARADVILNPENLLYCTGSPSQYALCFFSGPPYRTGQKPDNPILPCVLHGDVASCTCEVFTSAGAPAGQPTTPYFVDINGILNEGAYFQTVAACGHDGRKCANLHNCGKGGTKSGCSNYKQAPVCQYVNHQNPNDPSVSLIPKADLISTFSFAMNDSYKQGSTSCTGASAGVYAGCMTAPCFFGPDHKSPAKAGDKIQCECPTWNGPYQIGQSGQSCAIASPGIATPAGAKYVWSASYMPKPVKPSDVYGEGD